MANFDTDRFGPEKMSSSFKPRTNEWCDRCNDYGKLSLPIHVKIDEEKPYVLVCHKVICYLCNRKKGSLYYLYNYIGSKPTLNHKYFNIPEGLTLEDIRRTSEEHPFKSNFTYNEILESRKKMF